MMMILDSLVFFMANLPCWQMLTLLVIAYITYYWLQVVKVIHLILVTIFIFDPSFIYINFLLILLFIQRPILACSNGPFKKFLLSHVPTLEMKYWPTFWCVESRAQTVFASLLRSKNIPNVVYRR